MAENPLKQMSTGRKIASAVVAALLAAGVWLGIGQAADFSKLAADLHRAAPGWFAVSRGRGRGLLRLRDPLPRGGRDRERSAARHAPGSAIVNLAAAASPIPGRSFLAAAALGDIAYALALIAARAGAGAVVGESPVLAGTLGAALLTAAVLVWRRRRPARAVG